MSLAPFLSTGTNYCSIRVDVGFSWQPFCTILARERGDLVGLSDCRRPEKTPVTEGKKKTKEKKTRRWRWRRACFSGCYLLTLLQLPRRAAQTPAGLLQHREKSQFCHAITWPRLCSGKRHLVDVVKML